MLTVRIGASTASAASLRELGTLLGAGLVHVDGDLALEFAAVEDAQAFVGNMLTAFPDERGCLVGAEEDTLIEAFPMFRVPDTVFHLLNHLRHRGLSWDGDGWELDVSESSTPDALAEWYGEVLDKLEASL